MILRKIVNNFFYIVCKHLLDSKILKSLYSLCNTFILTYENYNWNLHENGEGYLIKKISKVLNNKSIIFDVGAYEGEWTKYFLNYNNNFSFHLFEINNEKNKKYKNLGGGGEDIKINNFALGNHNNNNAIYYLPINTPDTSSLIENYHIKFEKKIKFLKKKCKIMKGDNYIKLNKLKKIDFLKIDTEGYELEVLKGFEKSLIHKKIKYIQFEFVREFYLRSKSTFYEIYYFLTKKNYKIYKIYPNKFIEVKNYSIDLEFSKYGNFLATKLSNFKKI
jgi:FkbM family methyltransferase